MKRLPGIGGTLFPSRYLAEGGSVSFIAPAASADNRERRRFERWWHGVSRTCGPASAVRAIFDLFAMPLFAPSAPTRKDPEHSLTTQPASVLFIFRAEIFSEMICAPASRARSRK